MLATQQPSCSWWYCERENSESTASALNIFSLSVPVSAPQRDPPKCPHRLRRRGAVCLYTPIFSSRTLIARRQSLVSRFCSSRRSRARAHRGEPLTQVCVLASQEPLRRNSPVYHSSPLPTHSPAAGQTTEQTQANFPQGARANGSSGSSDSSNA